MMLCSVVYTILTGTSTVDSDFSILRWEKDPFRKCISNFSLKLILQSNQHGSFETTVEVEEHAPNFFVE